MNIRTATVGLCVCAIVLGCYFGAQAFQESEDRARGYQTFVAVHGPKATVRAAWSLIGDGIGLGLLLCVLGWLPRSCLLLCPMAWTLHRYFRRWEHKAVAADVGWANGLTLRLLAMGVVAVTLALTEYIVLSYQHVPVAGLGTVSGHPDDRPLLAPREMRAWESKEEVFR